MFVTNVDGCIQTHTRVRSTDELTRGSVEKLKVTSCLTLKEAHIPMFPTTNTSPTTITSLPVRIHFLFLSFPFCYTMFYIYFSQKIFVKKEY